MSTSDGWSKLNFASCVIRQTRSVGALVLYSICNIVFVNFSDMVVDSQFHKFYGRPFACSIRVFIPRDRFRSVTPLGATRVNRTIYKDDAIRNHSAHAYYITRIAGGVI